MFASVRQPFENNLAQRVGRTNQIASSVNCSRQNIHGKIAHFGI